MEFSFPNVATESNYSGIENGGLFNRDQCRQLSKYCVFDLEKLLKHMMETEMELSNQLKLPNGSVTATEP